MSEELELKYSIDDAVAVETWIDGNFPPSPDQAWRTVPMTDRYFDAADGALSAAGYGARLRKSGRRTTLTLKTDAEVAGALHRRLELEGPATQQLTPEAWPESDARQRLLALAGEKRLVERFLIRQRRRERLIKVAGADLLAAIDTGVVRVAGIEAGRISQLEFERVRGRRAALQRIDTAMDTSGLGRPDANSKLATAARMADEVTQVSVNDLFAEAGRKVLRRHLLRLLDREVGTRGADELALKQMRVATRRLRATWRVFDDGFKASAPSAFLGHLRRLGQTLGAVRDLDVLLSSLPADPALGPLAEHWRNRRQFAFAELVELLGSKRYGRFIDRMLDFVGAPGTGVARRLAEAQLADVAPAALHVALTRMVSAGASAADGDDLEAWHELRIEGRRLRYSVEAFADVLAQKPARDILRRITRLQDRLGAMQDAVVAADAASSWLATTDSAPTEEVRGAVARYLARREAEIVSTRAGFARAWRGLSGVTFERLFERALTPLTNR